MADPRVLLVSPRRLEKDIWRCGQIECEDLLCEIDDVELIAPRSVESGQSLIAKQAARAVRRLAGAQLSFPSRVLPLELERDYDLLVFYAAQPIDTALLDSVANWRKRCKKAVLLVDELWLIHMDPDKHVQRFKQFDLLATMFYNSVEPLQAYTGVPSVWMPPGVDTLQFFPGLNPPPRTIDVYAMGRRSNESHDALATDATARNWTYLFDTVQANGARDSLQEHRRQLAELVKRSRYFVANKAKVDAPDHRGTQDEIGFRSFEGAAGGAVLLGETPNVPSLQKLFDWPDAHIHVPYGSKDFAKVIDSLDADPERVQRIRRANVVNSLRRHDWAHRWRDILGHLGMPPTKRLTERLATLEERARAIDHASWPTELESVTGVRSARMG
jgi:hypothetical protein